MQEGTERSLHMTQKLTMAEWLIKAIPMKGKGIESGRENTESGMRSILRIMRGLKVVRSEVVFQVDESHILQSVSQLTGPETTRHMAGGAGRNIHHMESHQEIVRWHIRKGVQKSTAIFISTIWQSEEE